VLEIFAKFAKFANFADFTGARFVPDRGRGPADERELPVYAV
jgi:hypothetical protein